MWLTKQRQKMWVWCQVSERYLLQIKMHQTISTSVCGRVTRHYAVFRTKMMKVVNRSVFGKEASFYIYQTLLSKATYIAFKLQFYILSALAFPENRTHDLGVASAMLYHLSYRKASWQWRRTNNTTYCIRLCTIPAGPETRTRNLRVTSPTLYPLGHDCPSGSIGESWHLEYVVLTFDLSNAPAICA